MMKLRESPRGMQLANKSPACVRDACCSKGISSANRIIEM